MAQNTNSGNLAQDKGKTNRAGKKPGSMNSGNFKNDPERASEAGKKGSSH